MTDAANPESGQLTEVSGGPYVRATLNPDPSQFQQIVAESSHTILEIGCGAEDPRISWRLGLNDLWTGCDPGIKNEGLPTILVHRKTETTHPQTKMVVFSSEVANIPAFKPNVLLTVAPNQETVAEGGVFTDDLIHFVDSRPGRNQYFLIALDTRTQEAHEYQSEALTKIAEWMNENGFKTADTDDPVLDRFIPNSADLGGKMIRLNFVHNPK